MTLAAVDLDFGYPSARIGRDANLVLHAGEVLCLLGPNGSGKTTLFKTLLGLLPPQGGQVLLDGAPLARLSPRQRARELAYVPQAHEAYFPFSVREAVLMGRTARVGLFSSPGSEDLRVVDEAIEALGIGGLSEAIYTRVSGGERQLTLIARALAQEPRVLIMDEPTASLDFGNQMLVLDHIRRLAARGLGIVLATHDPDHAFLCANRVAMLHDGELGEPGPPQEVITPESLERLYGVDVAVVELAEGVVPGRSGVRVCVPARLGRTRPHREHAR